MKTYLAITLFAVMLSACDSPKDEQQTQKNQQTRQSEKSANVQGGSSEERYQEALAAYDAADLEKAYNLLQELAQQGKAEAQNKLGAMYENGVYVTKDYQKAYEWFEKAARQNYAKSQANIGRLYTQGLGVTQDYNEARE